jgi:hypothetical protein
MNDPTHDKTRPGECKRGEAARILAVHPNTVVNRTRAGKIPYRQAGPRRAFRYSRAALMALVLERDETVRWA